MLLIYFLIIITGKPGLIKGDSIKPGAVVIDVGITMTYESEGGKEKFLGDVEFESTYRKPLCRFILM